MKKIFFPFLFFLILSLFFCHSPIFLSLFKLIQTDPGDTRFNNYILEHIHQYIIGNVKSFSSPEFYFPHKNNLYLSDPLIFFYPFYGIFRFFGFEYDTSFQLFMILSTFLNYFLCFYLFQKLDKTKSFFNCFGSFLFSSANMRVAQIGHQQLLQNFYILLFFLFIFFIYKNYKENPKKTRFYFFLLSISLIFQLYSAFYNFYSLSLYLFFTFIFLFLIKTKEIFFILKKYLVSILLSLLIFFILAFPYFKKTNTILKEVGKRNLKEVQKMLPQLKSYFFMGNENLLFGKLNENKFFNSLQMKHEQRISFGYFSTILLIFSFIFLRKNFLITLNFYIILTFFLLTLYIPPNISLWNVIYKTIPGAFAIRAVTRFNLLLLLPFSFTITLFLKKINKYLALLFCLIIVFEQKTKTPAYDKFSVRKDVEALSVLAKEKKIPFYYSPLFGNDYFWKYQMDAQWASLLSRVPTINGYSGNQPKGWDLFQNAINKEVDFTRIYSNLFNWYGNANFYWIEAIPENKPFFFGDSVILKDKLHYFIDWIGENKWKDFKNPIKIKKEKEEIKISGWAKDLRFDTKNLKIYLKINNFTLPLNYGIERKDVESFYGKDYRYSGFDGKINSYYLNEKNNQLNFIVVLSDKYYYLKKTGWVIDKK